MGVEIRLLGPLETLDGTRPVALPRGRARSLFALLALHPGEVMAADRLVDALWGETPPPTARTALHGLVSALRRRLEPQGPHGSPSSGLLQTLPPGYRLAVDPAQVDAHRFRHLVERATEASPAERSVQLRAALALWRGPALAEFAYEPFAQTPIAALEELRLTALEERIEVDLAVGRHAAVVGELRELVAGHPLRELLRAHLMLALYRCGRQAEALEAYQDARRVLVEELGIDPGPALAQLGRAILRQDPSLALSAHAQSSVTASSADAAAPLSADAPIAAEVPPLVEALPWLPSGRKPATVVFVDLTVPSSALAEADPEAVRHTVAGCFEAASEVFTRHGGSVKGFIGDVVVAVFGLPTAHEDDALRAVRATSELRRAVMDLNESALPGGTQPVARVGVNTGEIVVGDPATSHTAAAGAAVKVAARLQQAAQDNEILLGDTTRRLVGDAAVVEPVEAAASDDPARTRAWRLVALADEGSDRGLRPGTPLVGRTDELDRLRAVFDHTVGHHQSALVTVLGDPGVGKSRLALELADRLGDEARVLTGRCPAYGEGITFLALREVVLQAAGDHRGSAILDLLAGQDDAQSTAARVATAIGLTGGAADPRLLFPAIRRLFEALAGRRPLVVVFEDVHWAQQPLLDLVGYLAETTRAPLMLLCLARPEFRGEHPVWARDRAGAATLVLEPLGPEDSAQLVADRLAGGTVPAETRDRVLSLAQGNPLFLEQLVAALREDHDLAVPLSLHALLAARLDRLGPAERDLARCASVLGTDFSTAALTAMVPSAARGFVGRHLRSLRDKQLVRRSSATLLGEPAFAFRHVLIQDAAYRSMTRRDRAELHERFAAWLDSAAGDRSLEYEELVAYHLEQAHQQRAQLGLRDEHTHRLAVEGGERMANAGLRAYDRFDVAATANLLSRARALLPADHPRRREVTEPLPEVLQVLGRHRDAGEILTELLDAARRDGRPQDEPRLCLEQARIGLFTTPDLTSLDEVLDEARQAWETLAAHDDDAGVASAAYVQGLVHLRRGELREMEAVARRGLAHAERSGSPREEAAMQWFVALALAEGPTTVAECIRECEQLVGWRGGRHPGVLAELARLRAMQGDRDQAHGLVVEARRLFVEGVRGRRPLMFLAQRHAEVELLPGGDVAVVEAELQAGLDLALDMEERDTAAQLAAQLSRVLSDQGRLDEAVTLASVSLDQAPVESVTAQALSKAATAHTLVADDEAEAIRLRARPSPWRPRPCPACARTLFSVSRGSPRPSDDTTRRGPPGGKPPTSTDARATASVPAERGSSSAKARPRSMRGRRALGAPRQDQIESIRFWS